MEYRMYGLVFSQFFWPKQYARLGTGCWPPRRRHLVDAPAILTNLAQLKRSS